VSTCNAEHVAGDPEHLKMIQAVITRMAGNSFLIKGWAVSLVAGLTALAKADTDRDIAWISCGVIVLFALLDAYYLAVERKYRKLYEDADAGRVAAYSLAANPPGVRAVLSAVGSVAIFPLYVMAAAGAFIVATSI
jgi:hypothetical protein